MVKPKSKVFSFLFSLIYFFSCSPENSGFVDVPTDHGEDLKFSKSVDEITVPIAGNYSNLLMAVDGNLISALYTTKGQSCYFIESVFTKFSAEVNLNWRLVGTNRQGEGKITVEKDAVWIQLFGNPKGCSTDLFKSVQKFPITKVNNWRKISAVYKNSVEISSEPLEGMKNGQSFKKGDIICILEQKKDWIRVEKIAQSPQVGWIKAIELEN